MDRGLVKEPIGRQFDAYQFKDSDELYGDEVVAEIQIKVRRNGAMSTGGAINNLEYALAMLDGARDAVLKHHHRLVDRNTAIMVPQEDLPKGLLLPPGS